MLIILLIIIIIVLYLYITKESFKNNYKMCEWSIKPYLKSDNNYKKNKIHSDFFDLIDKINIPWQLQYGSLLGAVRNHGPIEHDNDLDIVLLPKKNDIRFRQLVSYNNTIYNRRMLLSIIDKIIKSEKRFNKFYMVINAYDKKNRRIYDYNKHYTDKDLKITGYFLTFSILPINPNLQLNYPYVFDITFKYVSQRDKYLKQFGSFCKCKWNKKLVDCPKGALKHLYGWYGSS